jgi:hypothetical protein
MMNLSGRTKSFIAAAVLFLSGAAVGGAAATWCTKHRFERAFFEPPARRGERILGKLQHELKLDPEQRETARLAVDEMERELAQLRARHHPEAMQIRDRAAAKLRERLRPAQRERFDELLRRLEQKRERFGKFRGAAGGET